MAQVATMNQAQLQILDMLSFIKTPEALRDLNKVISDYFVQMADAELDRMWNEGTLNEERIESFRHLHDVLDDLHPGYELTEDDKWIRILCRVSFMPDDQSNAP